MTRILLASMVIALGILASATASTATPIARGLHTASGQSAVELVRQRNRCAAVSRNCASYYGWGTYRYNLCVRNSGC